MIISTTIFIVLSSWQSHCESLLGSRDEYRNGARWTPTCRPASIGSQSTTASIIHCYTLLLVVNVGIIIILLNYTQFLGDLCSQHWQIPLSKRFRALKLWFVMRSFGIRGLQQHVREVYIRPTCD